MVVSAAVVQEGEQGLEPVVLMVKVVVTVPVSEDILTFSVVVVVGGGTGWGAGACSTVLMAC